MTEMTREELEKDYKVLQTSYNILKDNDEKIIKEMGEQIEKMRCCKNCLHNGECDLSGYEECKNFDKWEIKEK